MAYWIDASAKVNNSRQITFYMDGDSDKNSLPTASAAGVQQGDNETNHLPCGRGSKALSIATGKIYILNSTDQWIEIGG